MSNRNVFCSKCVYLIISPFTSSILIACFNSDEAYRFSKSGIRSVDKLNKIKQSFHLECSVQFPKRFRLLEQSVEKVSRFLSLQFTMLYISKTTIAECTQFVISYTNSKWTFKTKLCSPIVMAYIFPGVSTTVILVHVMQQIWFLCQ